MPKKIFMIALLLLATFIAGYFQWNLFLTSNYIPMSYCFISMFINGTIAASAIIVFNYVIQKDTWSKHNARE